MEKYILIDKQAFEYHGLFDMRKLFLEIDQWIRDKGYDRYEKKNYQQVTQSGMQVYLLLEPWKSVSDYAKQEIKIEITGKDILDVEIDNNGVKEKLQKGYLRFQFQARLRTDYENKWENTPVYQFMRTLVDKYVHKTQTQSFSKEVISDTYALQEELKAFLNLYRHYN